MSDKTPETLPEAMGYARTYWQFGHEAATQRALTILEDTIRRARVVQPGHSAGPTYEELHAMVTKIRAILNGEA